MSFMDSLRAILKEDANRSTTENGAVGYRTSGAKLLDINYQVSSLRDQSEQVIQDKFADAFYEDRLLAVKWLFYAGDIRGGLGERRLFRTGLRYLGNNHSRVAEAVISLIPEYNRWDSIFCLMDTALAEKVIAVVRRQLDEDMGNRLENKPISLLAKWMPSVNASSKETRRLARLLAEGLGITEREYRKMLARLREYLKVTEVSMSRGDWGSIDYPAVPSRANLLYSDAFLRHDRERRTEYLNSLKSGAEKIHAGVLFPHDIVHQYYASGKWAEGEDAALEEMWKALPDYVGRAGNTICVADGSGSMSVCVGGTKVRCIEVANALAIYFAERSSGQFCDTYITFSQRPQLVDLGKGRSLREKLEIARRHNEVANTNIEAVFELILATALQKRMEQKELPENVLILSDMEFDACASSNDSAGNRPVRPTKTLFEVIAGRYRAYGYKLPRLVFWNICSRTCTIPVRQNELGVALVSGFSPSIVKMVLSSSTDPYQCLLEQINAKRYDAVEQAVKDFLF